MVKTALITGITGQDGAYPAEMLLARGYQVHGIERRSSSFDTGRIDHLYQDPHDDVRLHYGDMTDSAALTRIIADVRPDEIYNLAAQSHVAVSFETPEYTANADAVGRIETGAQDCLWIGDIDAQRDGGHACDYVEAMWLRLQQDKPDDYVIATGETRTVRSFIEAREAGAPSVTIWGTGTPCREFPYVDDLVDACVFAMKHGSSEDILDVGTGEDVTIADFARTVARVVGYEGEIAFDLDKLDDTPRKLLDVSRLAGLGWRATPGLEDGSASAHADFRAGGGRNR